MTITLSWQNSVSLWPVSFCNSRPNLPVTPVISWLSTFAFQSPIMWRRQWHPTPVLLAGKSHRWRSLVGCSPWGREESDVTEGLHSHCSLSCIGEGNGNPLQCSCLENPRDRGAWWAAVYGVAQSQTWLKQPPKYTSRLFLLLYNQNLAFKPQMVLCNLPYILFTKKFQMFKLDIEKAEEPEIILPTSAGPWKKKESSR